MSLGIREIIDEDEFALVLDALEREKKRAKANSRKPNHSKKASHVIYVQNWHDKSEMIGKLISKLAQNWD